MGKPRGLTNTQTALLAGLAGVLALILLIRSCGSGSPEKTITLACPACHKVFWDQPLSQESKPCPACGKGTLQRAVQCYQCNHVFPEPPLIENPESPVEPLPAPCPNCGSTDIGEPNRPGDAE